MEVTLLVRSGDAAGKRFLVEAGATLSIGRSPPAQVQLNDDPMLSNPHFQIEFADVCRLKDLASKFGTKVNGQTVAEVVLKDGDQIIAGQTRFAIRIRNEATTGTISTPSANAPPPIAVPLVSPPIAVPLAAPPIVDVPTTPKPSVASLPVLNEPLPEPQASVLRHLRSLTALYGLFDAAREPTVVPRLQASGLEHQCLYDGVEGEQLAPFGPWLVRFPRDAAALEEFVRDGWGQSWGVYVVCDRSLTELRRHLRQFLLVRLPDAREVYFRYYDPRVLRVYLPTCTPDELRRFFGPIQRYVVEGANASDVLEFTASDRGWRKMEVGR